MLARVLPLLCLGLALTACDSGQGLDPSGEHPEPFTVDELLARFADVEQGSGEYIIGDRLDVGGGRTTAHFRGTRWRAGQAIPVVLREVNSSGESFGTELIVTIPSAASLDELRDRELQVSFSFTSAGQVVAGGSGILYLTRAETNRFTGVMSGVSDGPNPSVSGKIYSAGFAAGPSP